MAKTVHVRLASSLLVVALMVGTWALLTAPATVTKAVPKLIPHVRLADFSTGCIASITAWGSGAILLGISSPAGWVTVAGWGLGIFGAYQTADACSVAKNYYGPPIAKTCFSSANYKGTYNGVKYYTKATAACAAGMGAGGGGGGSW